MQMRNGKCVAGIRERGNEGESGKEREKEREGGREREGEVYVVHHGVEDSLFACEFPADGIGP